MLIVNENQLEYYVISIVYVDLDHFDLLMSKYWRLDLNHSTLLLFVVDLFVQFQMVDEQFVFRVFFDLNLFRAGYFLLLNQ